MITLQTITILPFLLDQHTSSRLLSSPTFPLSLGLGLEYEVSLLEHSCHVGLSSFKPSKIVPESITQRPCTHPGNEADEVEPNHPDLSGQESLSEGDSKRRADPHRLRRGVAVRGYLRRHVLDRGQCSPSRRWGDPFAGS